MVNQQLLDWIKAQKARGQSDQVITDILVKRGWKPEDVKSAMSAVQQPIQQKQPVVQQQPVTQPAEKPGWKKFLPVIIAGSVCFLLIVGVIIFRIFIAPAGYIEGEVEEEPDLVGTDVEADYEEDQPVTEDEWGDAGAEGYPEDGAAGVAECGDIGCFEGYFATCSPATFTFDLLGNTYYFLIVGPRGGMCQVNAKVIDGPDPLWIGKVLICNYDNSVDFSTAFTDTVESFSTDAPIGDCIGSLVYLLGGLVEEEPPVQNGTDYNIVLAIDTGKGSYEIGEAFAGNYSISYGVAPLESFVLLAYSFNGSDTVGYVPGVLPAEASSTFGLRAFRIDASGYAGDLGYFEAEGSYTFELFVYDCLDIEAQVGKSCLEVTGEEALMVVPLVSESAALTVAGGQLPA